MPIPEKPIIHLEEGWDDLGKGIEKLKSFLEGETDSAFTAEEYMHLYTTVYNMCTQKHPNDYSEHLYTRYQEAFNVYVKDKVAPKLTKVSGVNMLGALVTRWNNHKMMVRLLSRIFNYLDRYYVTRRQVQSLKDVGLICFRDLVYVEMKANVKDAVVALIDKERDGELIDRKLLREVLEIFAEIGMGDMGCYEQDFEEFMLKQTASFYRRKAADWIQEDSCPEYMLKAEECLARERARVRGITSAEGETSMGDGYLHASSEAKILREVENEVLASYQTQLLGKEQSGCAALLRDDKTEDLSRMYRLFSRIDKGREPVAAIFKKHVEAEGVALVKAAEESGKGKRDAKADATSQDAQFVRKVMKLHDKYRAYVNDCFGGKQDSMFHKAQKEAFEVFCNKNILGSPPAELMATFCDGLLKKGSSSKLSDEEIEETLEKFVQLLTYISDKDIFGEFYRKKLSKRLLFDRSASEDHERSVLSKLKQQCGAQFTSKMEGMVNDLNNAKGEMAKFQVWKSIESNPQVPIDVAVTVLTTGHWPNYKTLELSLPNELTKSVEVFEKFYGETHNNRKLQWVYTLGGCHITAHFNKGKKLLAMTTMQAATLMLFGDEQELSVKEVCKMLNAPEEDTLRMLHSLGCSKYKILKKTPEDGPISMDDKFTLNVDFKNKMHRIKIPMPTSEEKKKVLEDVDKDRRHTIDAACVRIMKARKSLKMQELLLEVVQQLNRMFKPDFKMIKKRVETLIDRDYLERDKDNNQLLCYVA